VVKAFSPRRLGRRLALVIDIHGDVPPLALAESHQSQRRAREVAVTSALR
jgi:hypothetical protein